MENSETSLVKDLNYESIDRLYVVNQIRDRLIENNDSLRNVDVLSVRAFGSTIRGTSQHKSDLDLTILLKRSAYNNKKTIIKKRPKLEKTIETILDGFDYQVSFSANKYNNYRCIHITFGLVNSNSETLYFAEDSVLLWSNNESARSGIIRKIKKGFFFHS